MPVYVKPNGVPKDAIDFKVKVGGAWKQGIEVLTKVGGKWKRVWKGDYLDFSVVHTSTVQYIEFEDIYEDVPNYAAFIGLEMSVYGASGNLLTRETLGTNDEPEVISSASYSLYDDDNMFATISIYVDKLNSAIRYTISRTNGIGIAKVEIKIAKIMKV